MSKPGPGVSPPRQERTHHASPPQFPAAGLGKEPLASRHIASTNFCPISLPRQISASTSPGSGWPAIGRSDPGKIDVRPRVDGADNAIVVAMKFQHRASLSWPVSEIAGDTSTIRINIVSIYLSTPQWCQSLDDIYFRNKSLSLVQCHFERLEVLE